MTDLETELARVKSVSTDTIQQTIESIGFECTECGDCCTGTTESPHTATIFPDEIRSIDSTFEWEEIARPMPFGLSNGEDGTKSGETFEWALQVTDCGDCIFYEGVDNEGSGCSMYRHRPLICQTYPFRLAFSPTDQSTTGAVDHQGMVEVYECEGVGRDISAKKAKELAITLKQRTIRELEEAIALRNQYQPLPNQPDSVVVFDSEGAKHADGTPIETT